MTYRLKTLSSLLILSLLLISKPVKSSEAVVMFALPFIGAIVNQSWKERNSYDHEAEMAEFYYNHNGKGGYTTGEVCKQNDGSWKINK